MAADTGGMRVSWVIRRQDPDGSETVVSCVDDQMQIGMVIDEDRRQIDWEPMYKVEKE